MALWIFGQLGITLVALSGVSRIKFEIEDGGSKRTSIVDGYGNVFRAALLIFITLSCVVALLGYESKELGFSEIAMANVRRISWPFLNSNHLALIANIGLLFLIGFLRLPWVLINGRAAQKERSVVEYFKSPFGLFSSVLVFGIVALLVMTIVLSGSRTGILLLFTEVVAFLIFYWIIRKSRKSSAARKKDASWITKIKLLGGLLMLVVLLMEFPGFGLVGQTNFGGELNRVAVYKATLENLMMALPLGVGWGGWSSFISPKLPRELSGFEVHSAHSDILQMVLELGVPGVVILLLLCFFSLASFLKVFRISRLESHQVDLALSLVSLVIYLIYCLFHSPLRNAGLLIFLSCLLLNYFRALKIANENAPVSD